MKNQIELINAHTYLLHYVLKISQEPNSKISRPYLENLLEKIVELLPDRDDNEEDEAFKLMSKLEDSEEYDDNKELTEIYIKIAEYAFLWIKNTVFSDIE